jgi:hypothetical protein
MAETDGANAAWYGGLEPEIDYMLTGKPDDPEMRESASIWLFEENGEFAFPRLGIEAVGAEWGKHRYDCNMAFRGGRILLGRTTAMTATLPSPTDAPCSR